MLMNRNLLFKAKPSIVAILLSIKYIFLRRMFPFKKLISNSQKKIFNFNFNFSTYIILKASSFVFKHMKIRSCFTKSLVINEMLFLSGIANKIEIGILENDKEISSHCWVKIKNYYTEPEKVRRKYKVLNIT